MNTSVMLLMASFVLSLAGLFVFIASMTRGLFGTAEEGYAATVANLVTSWSVLGLQTVACLALTMAVLRARDEQ